MSNAQDFKAQLVQRTGKMQEVPGSNLIRAIKIGFNVMLIEFLLVNDFSLSLHSATDSLGK